VIIGSFAAGLVLARTKRAEEIQREVFDLGQFFIPIFFVSVGAAVNLGALDRRTIFIGLGLTAIGIVGKVAAGFAAFGRGLNRTVIGVGMIPRGEVGLIFAQIGLSTRLLDAGLYSAVAMMVLLTTLVTPPILRQLLRRQAPQELHGECDFVVDAPADDPQRPALGK
jgi:Na+:H+ antiporter